jgi:1-acyl-sn-glycerol-3-phosphate acyltransferase
VIGILGGPLWPSRRLWLWQALFYPVRAVGRVLYPMRLIGGSNVPRSGPYILVSNHVNWKDPPVIEFMLGIPIRFMAKIEAFRLFFLGGLLRGIGCFPVRRGESDRRAIVTCLQVLRAGNVLGYFPEGTRSRTGMLARAHPGVAFLAAKAGVPILPIGVTGTPSARLFRSNIEARVGPAFTVRDLGLRDGADEQEVADAIMRRVAALLPQAMRGYYTEEVPRPT